MERETGKEIHQINDGAAQTEQYKDAYRSYIENLVTFPYHMDPKWMSISELGQNWIVDCLIELQITFMFKEEQEEA